MQQHELAYIVRIKVWEDTIKVRGDVEKSLNRILGLKFNSVEVADANDGFTA